MSNPKDFKSSWEYINFYDSEETLNASYYADLVDHLVEQMTTPKPIEPKPKSKITKIYVLQSFQSNKLYFINPVIGS